MNFPSAHLVSIGTQQKMYSGNVKFVTKSCTLIQVIEGTCKAILDLTETTIVIYA
ncbi:uncharacterized protein LOC143228929 isoform X2 [Tachypleus tridentatus]|uniref:uncharacterized protein LOC143228929 isoform X2 n=1 Tax=Tachypleus tridentatus TaxID=6853 RepID=UPI003FD43DA1